MVIVTIVPPSFPARMVRSPPHMNFKRCRMLFQSDMRLVVVARCLGRTVVCNRNLEALKDMLR